MKKKSINFISGHIPRPCYSPIAMLQISCGRFTLRPPNELIMAKTPRFPPFPSQVVLSAADSCVGGKEKGETLLPEAVSIERQRKVMRPPLYNSVNTKHIILLFFLNPQSNVKEITQNILIVLAIQNTILPQIRLTI